MPRAGHSEPAYTDEKGNARPEANCAGAGKHVLIVDDEKSILELIRAILEKNGYVGHTAVDGMAALQRLESRPYNLIVFDCKMPILNGIDIFKTSLNEIQSWQADLSS